MRAFIIGMIFFLSACNGSDKTIQVPYSDPALVAKVDSLTKALAAATHENAQRFAKLQLVGQAHGVASSERTMAIGQAAVVSPNFGPCSDMGVFIGFVSGTNAPADPLTATYQAFKQCTGYFYETTVGSGALAPAQRIYFDGPNCTGNMYVWQAGGFGYNDQTLDNGVVFFSQKDGNSYMVPAGEGSVEVQAQSAWIFIQSGCVPDGDKQPMWSIVPNAVTTTGVPSSAIGQYQLAAP